MFRRMRQSLCVAAVILIALGVGLAQDPAGPPVNRARGRGAPRDPSQSPASTPEPKTVTPQTYPAAQVQFGEQRFTAECGFCHGRDASGGETGPDLMRSELVAQDDRGDKIAPLVKQGRAAQGMPAFDLSDDDVSAIVAFIHDQKTKSEALGGGRRTVDAADLATGDASAGRAYFNGAGGCSGCHSPTGDLEGIANRYHGLALLQRMLFPTAGRPAPARPTVTVTLESGETVSGALASEDEFTVVVRDASGERRMFEKKLVRYKIANPMEAHFDQLGKYTDADMHNVYAFLDTLK
jgi:cytochrome c oxidase cbb3-type subunit III